MFQAQQLPAMLNDTLSYLRRWAQVSHNTLGLRLLHFGESIVLFSHLSKTKSLFWTTSALNNNERQPAQSRVFQKHKKDKLTACLQIDFETT